MELRVARRFRSVLAERLDVVHGDVEASQVEHGVDEHRAVSGREHEAIAVGPARVARIEAQVPAPEHERHRRGTHADPGWPLFAFRRRRCRGSGWYRCSSVPGRVHVRLVFEVFRVCESCARARREGCGAEQADLAVEHDLHRHPLQEHTHAPLVEEARQKAAIGDEFENLRAMPPATNTPPVASVFKARLPASEP